MSTIRILAAAALVATPLTSALAQTVVVPVDPPPAAQPYPPSTTPLEAPPVTPPARTPESGSRALAPLAPTQNYDATPRQAAPNNRQLPMSGK